MTYEQFGCARAFVCESSQLCQHAALGAQDAYTPEEHRSILAFILKGDSQKAQQAIREHLSDNYLHASELDAQ